MKFMLRRLRLALATTEGKLKVLIVVSGTLILFLALTVGALAITNTPAFCSSCHEMGPEYFTWQGSAHNKVSCVTCHIKPGVKNLVAHKMESMKQLYLHVTGTYVTPIEMQEKIENSQCLTCHDMEKRVTTPSGDIKFPHVSHLSQQINCVECHSGIAHGNIEEKGFTALPDFTQWNAPKGKAYVSGKFNKLGMDKCVECHKESTVPVTCQTCHTKIVRPESHSDSNWKNTHGIQALQDIKACDKCHSVTSSFEKESVGSLKVSQYVQGNTFCNACHGKRPQSHDNAWRKTHVKPASENREGCLVCHSEAPMGKNDLPVPTQITCLKCHSTQHKLNPPFHPIAIYPQGYRPQCSGCHDLESCAKCHIQYNS